MKLRRQLDAVPGNAELNQYQRRFTELCTQGFIIIFFFFSCLNPLSISKCDWNVVTAFSVIVMLVFAVNEKQTELNGYYLLYNTLEDTKVYLNKELSLLTSIHDSFSQSMTSSAGKGEFLQQMEKIVTAVRQNKNKVLKPILLKEIQIPLSSIAIFFFLLPFTTRSRSRSKCWQKNTRIWAVALASLPLMSTNTETLSRPSATRVRNTSSWCRSWTITTINNRRSETTKKKQNKKCLGRNCQLEFLYDVSCDITLQIFAFGACQIFNDDAIRNNTQVV